ncbi:AAA family ATPase [Halobacillus litoralis]|uniref:Nuclease SbcCD subunit C n=1 Tax=Halobacillus litoralis TaxID=45668 RepID=A0A845DWG1_9BACI|nr:AAA family ATPase [Halobacillus litoralis]
MIIKKLSLCNFRQYYGEQVLEFSSTDDKNVTVIHGENGSGKTALLNSFNWVLYNKTDLPDPDKLFNNYAFESTPDAGKLEMYVEIEFESKGFDYILKRSLSGIKYGNKLTKIENNVLLKFFNGEVWKGLSNPTEEINQVLPEDLRNYFFFDGERIDHLSRHEDNDEIRDAIKIVMDLEIIERGIKHTEDARKEFQKEWADIADEQTKRLLEEQDLLKEKQNEKQERLNQMKQNIIKRKEQIKDVDEQLSLVKGVSEKQQERKHLETELEKLKATHTELTNKIRKAVSKQSYLAAAHLLKSKVDQHLSDMDIQESSTYPDLPKKLINTIIQDGVCICGESITDEHKSHLEELAAKIGPQNRSLLLNTLKRDMGIVIDTKERFLSDLHDLEKSEYKTKEIIRDTEDKLVEISTDLSNREYEDVQSLEKKRREYQSNIDEYLKQQGVLEDHIKDLESEIASLTKKIEEQEQIQNKAQLAKKRMQTCEKLTSVMNRIYNLKEEEVKKDLQEKLEEVYNNFLRKGFKINLTEDFKINVQSYTGDKVPLSQGERQITSLSFIGAIVDIARKHHKKSTELISEGGIYPLVMDSPFGALDSDHRERVARGIHSLSEQIVIIVSTSQWKGEVEGALNPYIGNQYTLNYHDSQQHHDTPYEYTEIQRW